MNLTPYDRGRDSLMSKRDLRALVSDCRGDTMLHGDDHGNSHAVPENPGKCPVEAGSVRLTIIGSYIWVYCCYPCHSP